MIYIIEKLSPVFAHIDKNVQYICNSHLSITIHFIKLTLHNNDQCH